MCAGIGIRKRRYRFYYSDCIYMKPRLLLVNATQAEGANRRPNQWPHVTATVVWKGAVIVGPNLVFSGSY